MPRVVCGQGKNCRVNIEELVKQTGKSKTYWRSFKKASENYFNETGVRVNKTGRGESVDYYIEQSTDLFDSKSNDCRQVSCSSLKYNTIEFTVFLGVLFASDMNVFRGTVDQFLNMCKMEVNDKNRELINEAIQRLTEHEVLKYMGDIDGYFTISLGRTFEKSVGIERGFLLKCKTSAGKYHLDKNKGWVDLVKVGLAVGILEHSHEKPYLARELESIVGLNENRIRQCVRILDAENLIKKSLIVEDGFIIGQDLKTNAIEMKIGDLVYDDAVKGLR